ncbi:MAG TPA: hypothetical protein VN436_06520 [Holophaga sp.]|nr:hypothetical protein [Holophaga sp.]
MKHRCSVLLLVGMLASLGCDRTLAARKGTTYVPSEEGLTLIYEDPTLPPAARAEARLQMRVSTVKETPQGRRVTLVYTTLKGQNSFEFLSKDGGWALVEGNTLLFRLLPEGFPDRTDHWVEKAGGMAFHVIGRGRLQNADLQLPEDYDREGIWVELEPQAGPKRRIFFLPGIGEAESQVLRDGRWVPLNRLVSRGFTDPPAVPPAQ